MTLLWQNDSPYSSSGLGAFTISIDWSQYDLIGVYVKQVYNANNPYWYFCKSGTLGCCSWPGNNGGVGRQITFSTNTISFACADLRSGVAGTLFNIPLYVYGVKNVSTPF